MTSVLERAPSLVRAPAALTWHVGRHVGRHVLGVPALAVREAATVPRSVARAVVPPPAECRDRQVWTAGSNAMIEVRELDRAHGYRRTVLAGDIERAMRRVEGIRWAKLDAATSRIAVRFDRERHDFASLVDALAAAERLVVEGLDENEDGPADDAADLLDALAEESEADEAEEPAGPGMLEAGGRDDPARHRRALAVHVTALGAAVAGRLAGVPRLPAGSGAVVALLEHQPWVRHRLERGLGPAGTDRLLTVAGAITNGLTRNVAALLLDTAVRGSALRAAETRLSAFEARRPELHAASRPAAAAVTGTDRRPVALPHSPVDRLARRMARAALVASGAVLGATGNPDLAGRVVLVAVPRAAHLAKQGYVDALVVGLGRRGVVVQDSGALRRLDRVTAVLVESGSLHGARPLIVTARADAEGWTDARVWRAAQRLLDGDATGRRSARRALRAVPAGDGRGERRLLTEDGVPVGEVTVGRELDPFTDALLAGVREAGLRLLLTDDPTAAELGNRADQVVRYGREAPGWLRAEVRRLQAGGDVVALVGTDQEALDAADVGIGLVPGDGAVPWAADLLCGPGLVEVPRIVAAMREARAVDQRGVRVSLGASFLGALILALGPVGGGGRAQVPVTMAGAGALLSGIRAGRAVARRPDPVPVLHTPWHALDGDEVLARLPYPGPAEPEVADGAGRPGVLSRTVHTATTLARNVRAELADPLTPVLGTGAAASAVIGSPTDAFLVGGVLAGSATISGAQRMRAEQALAELLSGQRLTARVVDGDDGERPSGTASATREVPATHLKAGHILDLRAGDVVPADARLLVVEDLEVDEATLTGESTAISKDLAATPGAELPDRVCMVYEGTTVVAGWARAVVVAVGAATEAGRALALAGRASAPAGMQSRLEELTRKGVPVTMLGGAAVTAMALLRGRPLRAAIGSGVSVAVAAVPEGLPLMASVAQLGAARRLSRRGVLVRASRTVEALGRVDTLCFDKTGTLTEGRLRLVRAAGLDGEWPVDAQESRRLLREAAHAGPSPNGNRPLAHATDQAVLDAAQAVLGTELDRAWEELAEIPFHSGRGFSAVVGRTPTTTRLVVKGAPEVLLPRCTAVRDDQGKRPLDREGHARAVAAVHSLAAQGLRVLAVARRSVDDDVVPDRFDPDDVADIGDLTLLGFLGLADTPRPKAAETVAALRRAGVATVMITGDHPVTARAIAGTLGIDTDHLMTGPELAALEESARASRVADASVFARVSPEQKLQIIEALQHTGRVVAMVGDGANDAAAIRLADVGIGMAAKGSTSARSAADLVFTEPDVSLVLDALVEGRAMWGRVRDAVAMLLGGNVGEVAFTLLGTALAGRAPISTRQFLVVNMFTDLLPSMALALAPTPADPEERSALLAAGPPSLGAPLLRDIGVRGTVTALSALAAWQIGRVTGTRRRASTIALAALVGAELAQTLLLGGRNPLVLATGIGSAAALAAIIEVPGVSQFFGCTPLDPVAWGVVLACSAGAGLVSAALPRLARHRPTTGGMTRGALVPVAVPE